VERTQRDARAAPDVARAVARYGLPGAPDGLPDRPLDDVAFGELLAHVRDGRVPALLARAAADGAFPLTPAQSEDLDALHAAAAALVAVLEETVAELTTLLVEAGVETRVLKGPALAHLDYPDPSWRTYGDVDILVRGRDLDRAVAALRDAGYERRLPELRPGFDRRFAKGVPLTNTRVRALEVDLHRTLADGPFGATSRTDDLFAASQPLAFRDHVVRALIPEDRLVHASFHVALSAHLRLSSVRDLVQLALVTRPDADAVLGRAREWRAEAVLARGVTLAWRILGLDAEPVTDPLVAWARSQPVDDGALRALAASIGPDAGWPVKALTTVRALRPRDRLPYLHALLWPTREFLDARGVTRRARWRHAVRVLRVRDHH
jgi:hypothetical protein